jgi:outer membrane protein assembly factor BamB
MRTIAARFLFACALSFTVVSAAPADDWVHWRGPEETGVARGQNLPDTFDVKEAGKNGLVWKLPIGGRNAPLVLKGRIYVLDGYDQKLPTEGERVVCLDEATGKTLWEHRFNVFHCDIDSSRVGWTTLTADPEHERVYCHASAGTMFCFDRDGKVVWKHEMTEEYGRVSGYGGRIVSPVFDSGLVIQGMLNASWGDYAPGRMRWVAFDGATGAVVWWTDTMNPVKATHASGPVIACIKGERLLIAGGGDGYVHALHIRSGKFAWSYQLANGPINPTPVVDGNLVYCAHGETNASGQLGGVVCLDGATMDPAHKGPVPRPKKVWEFTRSTRFGLSSLGYADGRVYMPSDTGEMFCFDGKTGKQLWKEGFGTVSRGAPLICDGKLYVFDVLGSMTVMTLDGDKKPKDVKTYRFKSRQPGVQMETHGTPIAVNGRLYFLTREDFFCVGAEKPTPGTGKYKALAEETAFDPAAAPASIRIAPADILSKAGATEKFEVKFLDAAGRELKAPAGATAVWSLPAPPPPPNAKTGPPPLRAQLSPSGLTAQVVIDKPPQAPPTQQGTVAVKVGNLTASARVRVAPEVGFRADFSKPALGAPPGGWINAAAKYVTAEYQGKRVLSKTNVNSNPYVAKANTYITGPDAANYTIECDMVGVEVRGKLPDIGLVNSRYQIVLDGKVDPSTGKTTARLITWDVLPRLQTVIPFEWKSGTWYRVKLTVDPTGPKGVIKGKIWDRTQPEPEKWTLEMEDPSPNRNGAAAIYGYIPNINAQGPGSEAFYDNLAISPNKK